MFKRILRGYSYFLTNYKYSSQSLTAGLLWATGDLISQKLTNEEIDYKRLVIMTSFGTFLAGPLYTFWYNFLDANVFRIVSKASRYFHHLKAPNTSTLLWNVTLAKVGADMIIFDPPYLSLFFSFSTLMAGGDLKDLNSKISQEFKHTYIADVAVWTPIQLINFRYLPVLYQPILVNSVNVGWNAYLSFVQNRKIKVSE